MSRAVSLIARQLRASGRPGAYTSPEYYDGQAEALEAIAAETSGTLALRARMRAVRSRSHALELRADAVARDRLNREAVA